MWQKSDAFDRMNRHPNKDRGAVYFTAEDAADLTIEITEKYFSSLLTEGNYEVSERDEISVAEIILARITQ